MQSLEVTYPTGGLLAACNLAIDDVIEKYQLIWQFEAYTDSILIW